MSDLIKVTISILDKMLTEEGAKILDDDTGLDFFIWTSKNSASHSPRIKVPNTKDGKKFNPRTESFSLYMDKDDVKIEGNTGYASFDRISKSKRWLRINHPALVSFSKHGDQNRFINELRGLDGELIKHKSEDHADGIILSKHHDN